MTNTRPPADLFRDSLDYVREHFNAARAHLECLDAMFCPGDDCAIQFHAHRARAPCQAAFGALSDMARQQAQRVSEAEAA